MINYEYISSTPLFRLLEEHPLAGSYLENLRLADMPVELPLLAGLMLTEPVALKEFELTAVQVAAELAAWLCVMEKAGAAGGDDQIKLFFIGADGQLGPDGGNIIRHDGRYGCPNSRLLPALSRWRGRWYRCAAPCSCCR